MPRQKDPERVFNDLAKIFGAKIKQIDLAAFRRTLLDASPIVNKLNLNRPFSKTSSSFLHTAVWYRQPEICKWLLAYRADPNLQNLRGVSPMHFLAENIARKGDAVKECLRMLVKAGGDLRKVKNKQGFTAMDIIKSKKMEGTALAYLKDCKKIKGVQDSWRQQIEEYYDDSDVEEDTALRTKEIQDKVSRDGSSSSSSNSDESASSSERDTSANSESEAKETRTERANRVFKELLQLLAVQKGDLDEKTFCNIIRENKDLIQSGHLNLNQVTSKTGSSLLHACVWYMKLDAVKVLVEVGQADVMLKNNKGSTPLHSAAERGHKENVKSVIDVLMSHGASKASRTQKGYTPPQKAKIPEIAEYILGWPYGSEYEKEKKKEEAERLEMQQKREKAKEVKIKQREEMKAKEEQNKKAEGAVVAVERWELDWREMKILFDKMDWDKNGFLNFKDVRDSLINMEHSFANRNVDMMIKSADPDGDGQISWEEFKGVIQNYTEIPRIRVE